MYATTRISGPNGLGDTLPVACSGSSCYGTTPAADQAMQALQDILSRFASTVGATPLAPDYANGRRVAKIGPATVALAAKVAQYLATLYRTADVMTLLGMVTNSSDLAKFAATYVQIAAPYVKNLSAPAPPIPPQTQTASTTTPTTFPATTSMIPPPFAPPSGMSTRTMWIVAGVAAVVIGTVVYFVWMKE
jgi:hypothetical protein